MSDAPRSGEAEQLVISSLRYAYQGKSWEAIRFLAATRYFAMAGATGGLPDKIKAEAESDRETYGRKYLLGYPEDGGAVDPYRMVCFLVDICDLPFDQACIAAEDKMKQAGAIGPDPGDDPVQLAQMLYQQREDIFQAIETARFFARLSPEQEQWNKVVDVLQTGRMDNPLAWKTPPDTGGPA
jgi:hypothetical protein